MNYLFLLLFWIGVAHIPVFPAKQSLKERSDAFLGKLRRQSRNSFIAEELIRIRNERLRRKRLNELSESLAYIRNITVLGRGRSISAQLLLEEMSDMSVYLKKTYLDMAHALSVNDRAKAEAVFSDTLGEPYGHDIGSFLVSWEEIPPQMLLGNIDTYVDSIRQEKLTYMKRKDQMVSDLVYMPVILNCMMVLMNFIYIAYFIEQRDMLSLLF